MEETILTLLISTLGFVMARFIIPFINAKTTEANRNNVKFWATLAINTAETIYTHQTGKGADKKQFVIDFLHNKGVNLSEDDIEVVIEGLLKQIKKYEVE